MMIDDCHNHLTEEENVVEGIETSTAFPTMASIDRNVCVNLTPAHLLYAQEMYLARVKQYESSCKGKCIVTLLS